MAINIAIYCKFRKLQVLIYCTFKTLQCNIACNDAVINVNNASSLYIPREKVMHDTGLQ